MQKVMKSRGISMNGTCLASVHPIEIRSANMMSILTKLTVEMTSDKSGVPIRNLAEMFFE